MVSGENTSTFSETFVFFSSAGESCAVTVWWLLCWRFRFSRLKPLWGPRYMFWRRPSLWSEGKLPNSNYHRHDIDASDEPVSLQLLIQGEIWNGRRRKTEFQGEKKSFCFIFVLLPLFPPGSDPQEVSRVPLGFPSFPFFFSFLLLLSSCVSASLRADDISDGNCCCLSQPRCLLLPDFDFSFLFTHDWPKDRTPVCRKKGFAVCTWFTAHPVFPSSIRPVIWGAVAAAQSQDEASCVEGGCEKNAV